jgi:hypothetical protein
MNRIEDRAVLCAEEKCLERNSRNQRSSLILASGLAAVFGCNVVAAIYTFFAYKEEDGGWGKTYIVCWSSRGE